MSENRFYIAEPVGGNWGTVAQHWRLLGSPLRCLPVDVERMQAAWLATLCSGLPEHRLEILLLGVTPEVAEFSWAPDFHLTALDSSTAMIGAVWPGNTGRRRAQRGDWLKTPWADASFDLILTDGGTVVLGSFETVSAWSREMRRLLRPQGRVVARLFTGPTEAETPEAIFASTGAGQAARFDALKLRLLFALSAQRPDRRIILGEAWETFQRLSPDRAAVAARIGCSLESVATIDAYRECRDAYVFPSLPELAASCPEFALTLGPAAAYPLGECCPVAAFTPRV